MEETSGIEQVVYQGYGTVKWFNARKGYGFINYPQGSMEYEAFVHFSSIKFEGFKKLERGQTVSLRVIQAERGPQAEDVVIVEHDKKGDLEERTKTG